LIDLDMAVSTMLCSFFQMMGATIGLAVSGSVFNNAMTKYIPASGIWESSGVSILVLHH
jgi:hypothetical protein